MHSTCRRKQRYAVLPHPALQVPVTDITNVAQNKAQDPAGQEEGVTIPAYRPPPEVHQVRGPRGGLPAVRDGPEQTPAVRRGQRHRLLQDPEEVGQDVQVQDQGALPVAGRRGPALLQPHRHQRAIRPGDDESTGARSVG